MNLVVFKPDDQTYAAGDNGCKDSPRIKKKSIFTWLNSFMCIVYSPGCLHLDVFTWVHSHGFIHVGKSTRVHSLKYIQLIEFTRVHSLECIYWIEFT